MTRRLDDLVLRTLDGEASDEERAALERQGGESAEARAVIIEACELEGALRALRPRPSVAPAVCRALPPAGARTERVVARVMTEIRGAASRRTSKRRRRRAWLAVLALPLGTAAFAAAARWRRAAAPPGGGATVAGRAAHVPHFIAPHSSDLAGAARPPTRATAPAAEALFACDFEDEQPLPVLELGHVVTDGCATSARCALGTMNPYGATTHSVQLGSSSGPLFVHRRGLVLGFDYRVGEDAPSIAVQLWSPGRQSNFALRTRDIVRGRWARAEIRLDDLWGERVAGPLVPGDDVASVLLMGGRIGGTPFYVDNVVLEAVSVPPPRSRTDFPPTRDTP